MDERTPEDYFASFRAYIYIFIIFLGTSRLPIFTICWRVIIPVHWVTARAPLVFLLILLCHGHYPGSVLAIIVLKMGVAGAAWATVISQGSIRACCACFYMKTRNFSVLTMQGDAMETLISTPMMMLCGMGIPYGACCSPSTAIGSVDLIRLPVNNPWFCWPVASVTARR